MQTNKQPGGLDYFKIIAAVLVVSIHTAPFASYSIGFDYIATGIIARIAVPFFFMVTGYFLLPQYVFDKSKNIKPLKQFLKGILCLYMIATVLYLPVNFYAGYSRNISIYRFFRMLIFDGTFYHLWYLPAVMLGVLIVAVVSRTLPVRGIAIISIFLYMIGLFGDSYFGFIPEKSLLFKIYTAVFSISSYTRNGIFFAPVFLLMGAVICRQKTILPIWKCLTGFLFSISVMVAEGLILHSLNTQRHDCMYIMLLPCAFFLFQMILYWDVQPQKRLRKIAAWIYIIHPLMIILMRGAAKAFHVENIFIENSAAHFVTVCFLSCLCSVLLEKALRIGLFRQTHLTKERAWIEIDKHNLRHNVAVFKGLLPHDCQLMPAIKANAYGHGAILIAKELNRMGIKSFCVATISEGIALRKNNIKGSILILGYTEPKYISMIRKYRLTQTVIDLSYAEEINSCEEKIMVHIKIDTGMHRLGENAKNTANICKIFQCKNLVVTGIYTHLCADETRSAKEAEFTKEQGKAFYNVISVLKEQGYTYGKVHLLSSYGMINYPELAGNYVRVGIALYGVLSERKHLEHCPVSLYPILSLKARIAQVKELHTGENAGYGLQYIAKQDKKIAVLTIGYADGVPRALSGGRGTVLINGQAAPIIGNICMDQMLVDITEISNVKSGDIATIIGKDGNNEISAYDLSELTGTITNEVLSRLGNRLERVFYTDFLDEKPVDKTCYEKHNSHCEEVLSKYGIINLF